MDHVDLIAAQWRAQLPDAKLDGLVTWGLLKRVSTLVDRSLTPLMDAAGVNMGEFEVLAALRRAGPPYQLRPTDLTKSLIVTPGAITNRLTTLEYRDLIMRRALVDDRRGVVVALTAKGLHVFDTAFESVVARCDALLQPLGEDSATLRAVLHALLITLEHEVAAAAEQEPSAAS